jgi:hypothetical protein
VRLQTFLRDHRPSPSHRPLVRSRRIGPGAGSAPPLPAGPAPGAVPKHPGSARTFGIRGGDVAVPVGRVVSRSECRVSVREGGLVSPPWCRVVACGRRSPIERREECGVWESWLLLAVETVDGRTRRDVSPPWCTVSVRVARRCHPRRVG